MCLEYSKKALDARFLFFNKVVVYVEGKEDIYFWRECFSKCKINCTLQNVNGSIIKKYAAITQQEGSTYFVAMDRDYSHIKGTQLTHNQIITTPCYSIENIIFCKKSMINYIMDRAYLKEGQRRKLETDLDDEMRRFASKFIDFLYLDILNDMYAHGLEILSRHYINGGFNHQLLEELKSKFSKAELDSCKEIIPKIHENFFFEIRGHFLEGWACYTIKKFIKQHEKGITIDNASIKISLGVCRCKKQCSMFTSFLDDIKNRFSAFMKVRNAIDRQKSMNIS